MRTKLRGLLNRYHRWAYLRSIRGEQETEENIEHFRLIASQPEDPCMYKIGRRGRYDAHSG